MTKLSGLFRTAMFSAAIVTVGGCARKSDAPVDTAKTVATAATVPKGTMPDGWESKNSDEIRAIAEAVSWTDPVSGERTCADRKKCNKVGATISANTDARLVGVNNTGEYGVMMARMVLSGPYETAMYHLSPGAFKYYLIVSTNASKDGMNWALVQVADNGKSPTRKVSEGVFGDCGHKADPGAPAKADWLGCGRILKPTAQSGGVILDGADEPGWISCAAGCCTANGARSDGSANSAADSVKAVEAKKKAK